MTATKRTVLITDAKLVPAETIWPGRCKPGDMVLTGFLRAEHPVLGNDFVSPIRPRLIVKQDLANSKIETLNTIYEVVA